MLDLLIRFKSASWRMKFIFITLWLMIFIGLALIVIGFFLLGGSLYWGLK